MTSSGVQKEVQWFYTVSGQQLGPVTEEQLLELYNQQQIKSQDLVWCDGMKDWKTIGEVLPKIMRVIPAKPQPPQVPANPNINKVDVGDEYVMPVSPFDKQSTNNAQENSRHAWQRFVARMFDGIVYVVIAGIVLAVSLSPEQLQGWYQNLAGFSVYNVLVMLALGVIEAFFLSRTGMTPGKWIMRVRVVHSEQRFLTFSEALKRYFYVLIRGMGLGLFPLNAIFNALSYVELTQTGTTLWDKRLGSEVQYGQMQVSHKVAAAVLSAIMALTLLAMLG
ncbi:MAG: RDD family protein [Planctomycetes bacterium]|nr:RDD family protein [Planctomycetota bacterium]